MLNFESANNNLPTGPYDGDPAAVKADGTSADTDGRKTNACCNAASPNGWNHFFKILPYIEQQSLYNMANFNFPPIHKDRNTTANNEVYIARTAVAAYYCPSRRPNERYGSNQTTATSRIDYAGSAGFRTGVPYSCAPESMIPPAPNGLPDSDANSGAMYRGNFAGYKGAIVWGFSGAKRTLADFKDGTSNSIMVAEKSISPVGYGNQNSKEGGDNEWWHNSGWDEDCLRWQFVPVADTATPKTCADIPGTTNAADSIWRRNFGGPHPGGVNAVFGDGSVKFIKFSVDAATFRKLTVIDDGEVLSSDAY